MEQVLQQFCLDGTPISCEPLGNGHINRTFRVACEQPEGPTRCSGSTASRSGTRRS